MRSKRRWISLIKVARRFDLLPDNRLLSSGDGLKPQSVGGGVSRAGGMEASLDKRSETVNLLRQSCGDVLEQRVAYVIPSLASRIQHLLTMKL